MKNDLDRPSTKKSDASFPIVAIGASAGGLEAFVELLLNLPANTGMAFVLISHLSPDHKSLLASILSRSTTLPVMEVSDELEVMPNTVYVIPPGQLMTIKSGHLKLLPRSKSTKNPHSIDLFFGALAADRGHLAIGVVLSGTANDGTIGIGEIRAVGGITFAQDFTAKFDGMPRSVIASGTVDFILSPADIAGELAQIARHPYVRQNRSAGKLRGSDEEKVGRVMEILNEAVGVDFRHYKKSTLRRRINRRMLLHKLDDMSDYIKLLRGNRPEIDAMYQDMLVSVTSFFRNPEAYEALKKTVFPKIVAEHSDASPLRMWVVGCSTGEEAYSLAISIAEYLDDVPKSIPVQIFATDLNGPGIERARSGIYPKGSLAAVNQDRIQRFFIEEDGRYRVKKTIREMCVFAKHNALSEPPFSKMDLITCRNMLTYLEPVMQKNVLPMLHYALQPQGFLWLGGSETVGNFTDLFKAVDPKNRIYLRMRTMSRPTLSYPAGTRSPDRTAIARNHPRASTTTPEQELSKETDRILLQRYGPPCVVVNGDLEVVQFRGETGRYLAPAWGRASFNLLRILREGLLIPVRAAVVKARTEKKAVREEGLRFKSEQAYETVNIEVIPLDPRQTDANILILFEPTHDPSENFDMGKADPAAHSVTGLTEFDEIAETERLRQELDSTREYLQSVIEQREASNEELQSANEEIQSANEELQSLNEELETSKEELGAVNDELRSRNTELGLINNDLLNLLSSVQLPIVMLGQDLRIRRLTPAAEKALGLIASDVGRKLDDLTLNFIGGLDFEQAALDVIESAQPRQVEIQDKAGKSVSFWMRPYKTPENKIDGVILIVADVDANASRRDLQP